VRPSPLRRQPTVGSRYEEPYEPAIVRNHQTRGAPGAVFLYCERSRADHAELLRLAIVVEGITAGDYLTWVRDADRHALGRELRSVGV
jgi:hypothetical protein